MAIQFQTLTVNRLPANNQTVTFTNTVNTANAAIQSFDLSFGPDTDQTIDTIFVKVSGPQISGNSVTFNVDANMQSKDDTTTINTGGSGSVTVVVMADVKSAG